MRPIKIIKPQTEHLEDCKRIQDILINKGFYATLEQCEELWHMYSEDEWCAGWLVMKGADDEEIYRYVRKYFTEGPDSGTDARYL